VTVPCVTYAAKSTEDIRGSLATQAEDCRAAIDTEGERIVVAEYADEAVSGFSRSRGPELAAALAHVEALAAEHGGAELWVQHSDRLARGDGRTARHVVEIALWAVKAGVAVRPVEDVDTFRDLLYAVVTGQRNHEDSKRKGSATAAGLKRAIYRGEYAGQPLDGYRVAVSVDERGHVTKRLVTDPERKPVFALIFRLARHDATPGEISRKVNQAGWLTAPRRRDVKPAPFSPAFVRWILANPRYAGLAFYKGEIVAKGQWPAYISRREHERLNSHLRRTKRKALPREPFLLAHLAGCSECGGFMITVTGKPRADGSRHRTYVCNEHRHQRCITPPLDAAAVDHVFVASLNRFLGGLEESEPYRPSPGFPRELIRGRADATWERIEPIATVTAEIRARVHSALREGEDALADSLIEELIGHRARLRALTHSRPTQTNIPAPELSEEPVKLLFDFYAWSANDLARRLADKPEDTVRLNRVLRRWYARVMLRWTPRGIEIAPILAASPSQDPHQRRADPVPAYADPDHWQVALHIAGHGHRIGDRWSRPEIKHALIAWTTAHARSPHIRDWPLATTEHPNCTTVVRTFGSWRAALKAAGLSLAPVRRHTLRANGTFVSTATSLPDRSDAA
jgi:DNA invertase Pin-like site-specific DNA recombinase